MTTNLSSQSHEEEEEENGQIQKQQEESQNTCVSVLDLPSIAINILSRLPVRTLFNCRCVCKSWRNLLSDPYFAKIYLTRPPTVSIVLSTNSYFYLLELEEDYEYTCCHNRPRRLNTQFIFPSQQLVLVGSCNGLLLFSLYFSRNKFLYISNPILGEYAALPVPVPQKEKQFMRVIFGFGFSPATGQYKVLRVVLTWGHGYRSKSKGEVYTLGTDTWRNVGIIPFPLYGRLCDANLNGALHWIADNYEVSELIISFDIEKEQVRSVPQPPAFVNKTFYMTLGVLGDCLCLFDNSLLSHLEIWSMKHYGVVGSWTKVCILKTSIPSRYPRGWLRPITIWKDGEILISSGSGPLISYNPRGKSFTELKVYGFVSLPSTAVCEVPAVTFVPNFLSLKDVMM